MKKTNPDDVLLHAADVAAMLGVNKTTFYVEVRKLLPPPVALTKRPRWRRSAILAFIAALPDMPTATPKRGRRIKKSLRPRTTLPAATSRT